MKISMLLLYLKVEICPSIIKSRGDTLETDDVTPQAKLRIC